MQWPLDREVRTFGASLLLAVSAISALLAVQDIARLPLTVLLIVSVMVAIYGFVSVIVEQRETIADLIARLEMADDHSEALLDLNGLVEEGNGLARKLKRYVIPETHTEADVEDDKDGFTEMVASWNRRCVEVVGMRAPHMTGLLAAPIPPRVDPPPRPGVRVLPSFGVWWRDNLRHEVAVKIERLVSIQTRMGG
jgi:hypothetical protein